jgi:3-methyladenine DNA glycosylase/8-oxoguanine DNA glycosylase
LEESLSMDRSVRLARLRAIPGVGAWTAAEVAQRAWGDADEVSVGDFHLPALVGWALAGRPVDDDGMLELLAPYAGHRHRAVRLVEMSGARKPSFGPRLPVGDIRNY